MPRLIDRTGQVFGRLTVKRRGPNKGTTVCWTCKCQCGNEVDVRVENLVTGNSTSCGCVHREDLRARSITHGKSKTLTYQRWCGMKNRLKRDPHYAKCTVDPRWDLYETFLCDMGECPAGYSLERINNAKGYWPANCKWIPLREQPRNTTRVRKLTCNGRTMSIADWARELNVPDSRIRSRLKRGWSIQRALEQRLQRPPS